MGENPERGHRQEQEGAASSSICGQVLTGTALQGWAGGSGPAPS